MLTRKKGKKSAAQSEENYDMEEDRESLASDDMLANTPINDPERSQKTSIEIILKELREFRKDSCQKLTDIREDMNKMYKRVEEAEERIDAAETRIQSTEEVVAELVKIQEQTGAKLMDLEGRLRRENVRLYGVKEGAEEGAATMITYVEELLIKGLELPTSTTVNIERAHRALNTKPPPGAPPRSIVVKFASFRMKDDILKKAWQAKGFEYQGMKIHMDHDYAPELLKKRKDYTEAKTALKERNIRFQTPFPARLRVYYKDGTVVYNSAEEATEDMTRRGIPVTVRKKNTSLLDRISQHSWQPSRRRGNRERTSTDVKEQLQRFRRDV